MGDSLRWQPGLFRAQVKCVCVCPFNLACDSGSVCVCLFGFARRHFWQLSQHHSHVYELESCFENYPHLTLLPGTFQLEMWTSLVETKTTTVLIMLKIMDYGCSTTVAATFASPPGGSVIVVFPQPEAMFAVCLPCVTRTYPRDTRGNRLWPAHLPDLARVHTERNLRLFFS